MPAQSKADDEHLRDFRLIDTPGHLLRRCNQRSYEFFTELVGRKGPTRQQFSLMITAYQNPGATQSQIAAGSGIDRVTLTEILGRLVEKGWIERRRSASDGRAYTISLTARGLRVLRRVTPLVSAAQARLLEPLRTADQEALLRCLQTLIR